MKKNGKPYTAFSAKMNERGNSSTSGRDFALGPTIGDKIMRTLAAVFFDGEAWLRGLVCALLLVFFTALQVTVFARLKPFGAVPDLVLPLVCSVAITTKEKWGAVFGLVAAFVVDSVTGATVAVLPLLYMPLAYCLGIISRYLFRDTLLVRFTYIAATSLLRSVVTLFLALATVGALSLPELAVKVLLPELLANIVFALIPHYLAKVCLKPVCRTREDMVQ